MKRIGMGLAVIALLCAGQLKSEAGSITTYSSRPAFESALGGPFSVETFTSGAHFPITTGVLNSATNLVVGFGSPILPGDILPGVTYSTAIGSDFFFNIDAGGGYVGGFLDGFATPAYANSLTVAFDAPVSGFGFDTNNLMGTSFSVNIHFVSGPDYLGVFNSPNGFYGFLSDAQDITSAQILGTDGFFSFALDNFTFGGSSVAAVPEPGSLAVWFLAASVFSAVGFRRRLVRSNSAV